MKFISIIIIIISPFLLCSCNMQLHSIRFDVPEADEYRVETCNGHIVEIESTTRNIGNGQTVTIEKVDECNKTWLGIKRISSLTKIVQDSDGQVVEFEDEKHRGIRNPNGHYDIYSVNEEKKIREITLSDGCVFGIEMPSLLKEMAPQEGDILNISEFSIGLLEEVQCSLEIGPVETVSFLDTPLRLRKIAVVANLSFGQMMFTRYVNDQWETIKEQCRLGGLIFERVTCSREQIPAALEIYPFGDVLVIKSPVRIKSRGRAHQIRYCIKPVNDATLSIPHTDYQKISYQGDGRVFVDVYAADPPEGTTLPYRGNDSDILKALESTDLLQCDDPLIQELANKAIGSEKDTAKAVEKIRQFTNRYMTPSSKEQYDYAVDIAQAKKGDCKEYAILMTALCRSVGIPAKVVSGYVYHDVFVAHAWVQVYVGDKWYAVDPTRWTVWGLFNDHTVGHIATYIWEGTSDETMDIANSLATFKILSVRQD